MLVFMFWHCMLLSEWLVCGQGWLRARQRGTVRQYCYDNFLTPGTLLVTASCIPSFCLHWLLSIVFQLMACLCRIFCVFQLCFSIIIFVTFYSLFLSFFMPICWWRMVLHKILRFSTFLACLYFIGSML